MKTTRLLDALYKAQYRKVTQRLAAAEAAVGINQGVRRIQQVIPQLEGAESTIDILCAIKGGGI